MNQLSHNDTHGFIDHLVSILTSFTATRVTVTSGLFAWIFTHQSQITFSLMSAVFICQLLAFGYRFYVWLKKPTKTIKPGKKS